MKTLFRLAICLYLMTFGVLASAQNVRYDAPFPSVSSGSPPYLIANLPPNSPTLSVCSSPANAVPCTNYVTTYTSTGSACPNGSQDTPQPQPSACQGTGDAQGNIGFWAPAGTYDYTVCVSNNCFGPYTVTLGGTGSGTTTTIASGTATLGTSSISSQACATVVTVTATGVTSTDSIIWNPNASIKAVTGYAPSTNGGLSIAGYPTSGNVNFDVCNWTSNPITPGAVTLNWRVVR